MQSLSAREGMPRSGASTSTTTSPQLATVAGGVVSAFTWQHTAAHAPEWQGWFSSDPPPQSRAASVGQESISFTVAAGRDAASLGQHW